MTTHDTDPIEPDLCICGADSLEILLPLITKLRLRVEGLEQRERDRDASGSSTLTIRRTPPPSGGIGYEPRH